MALMINRSSAEFPILFLPLLSDVEGRWDGQDAVLPTAVTCGTIRLESDRMAAPACLAGALCRVQSPRRPFGRDQISE